MVNIRYSNFEKIVAVVVAVVLVFALLAVTILVPDPTPSQYANIRTFIALSVGVLGGIGIGPIKIKWKIPSGVIRGAGGGAIFLVVYLINPASPQNPEINQIEEDFKEQYFVQQENTLNELLALWRQSDISDSLRSEIEILSGRIKTELLNFSESSDSTRASYTARANRLANVDGSQEFGVFSAIEAIANANFNDADFLLMQISGNANNYQLLRAESLYQRAIIAKDQIRFSDALEYSELAVSISPDNVIYLELAGSTSRILGNYPQSIIHLEKALGNQIVSGQTDLLQLGQLRNQLGLTLKAQGKYDLALSYYNLALDSLTKIYDEHNPDLTEIHSNIGSIFHSRMEFELAVSHFEDALSSDIIYFGNSNPRVSIRMNNLGAALHGLGDYEKAIDYFEKSLQADEQYYPADHPQLAKYRNNLGISNLALRNYQLAANFFQLALSSSKIFYGESHPSVSNIINSLGGLFQSRDNHEKALTYFEASLEVNRNVFGEMSMAVGIDYNNIGRSSLDSGDYTRAIGSYERAVNIFSRLEGPEHEYTLRAESNLQRARELAML